jgi:hypothetical protein
MFTNLHTLPHTDAHSMNLMRGLASGNQMSLLLLLLLLLQGRCCHNCCTGGQRSVWDALLCHTMLHCMMHATTTARGIPPHQSWHCSERLFVQRIGH